MTTVLVTGAGGFIGRHLCHHLATTGYAVRASTRRPPKQPEKGIDIRAGGEINETTNWQPLLDGIATVVHLAARVHIVRETEPNPLNVYRRVNVAGIERLAHQAVAAGVRRFVLLSSIGAARAETKGGPLPTPYQQSKWEAELVLREIAEESGIETVILRPPLVYGPDAPGNFARLVGALRYGLPLPLASIRSRRSFIYVGNLVGAIALCLEHPAAPGDIFAVSDGEVVSTPEFIRRVAQAYGRRARLFPCPPGLLRLGGRLTGRAAMIESLIGDLVVDESAIRDRLGWRPPYDMAAGLAATAAADDA